MLTLASALAELGVSCIIVLDVAQLLAKASVEGIQVQFIPLEAL